MKRVRHQPRHREKKVLRFSQSYHDQQGPLRFPPRRRIGAGDRCLVVLNGWAIVRTTTSRQVAGARTLRDFIRKMSLYSHRKGVATTDTAQVQGIVCSPFRNSFPKQVIRRRAFCQRARELLPNLEDETQSEATARYGTDDENPAPHSPLEQALERRSKFYDWFADGKSAELIISNGMVPDGEIDSQFARCWQAALKATPNLKPSFALRTNGFRVPLPHGYYRFNRSILLNPAVDDGADLNVEVDPQLLRKGGLYCLNATPGGTRLEHMEKAMPQWRIALRMLRRYQASVRPEILRRLRSGVRFEFSRCRHAVRVTLRAGRMPDAVRAKYRARSLTIHRRLDHVRAALAQLETEGRHAAETFAAEPHIQAAQLAAARETAIATFRDARGRLWRIAQECYRRDSLPPWPYRTPDEISGCAKRGISPRQRIRLDHAIEWFADAYREVVGFDWNPIEDPCLTEQSRRTTTAQRILALGFPS